MVMVTKWDITNGHGHGHCKFISVRFSLFRLVFEACQVFISVQNKMLADLYKESLWWKPSPNWLNIMDLVIFWDILSAVGWLENCCALWLTSPPPSTLCNCL